MNKVIFYHPGPIVLGKSGSSIRPFKMLEALRKTDCEIIEISGSYHERKHKIKILRRSGCNLNSIDFIYLENVTTPFVVIRKKIFGLNIPFPNFFEILFLVQLKIYGVKIGYFLRDIHWLFPDIYRGVTSKARYVFLKSTGLFEILLIKIIANICFCPSEKFSSYLKEHFNLRASPLLPGSDLTIADPVLTKSSIRLLYVGGTGALYNPTLFINAFISAPRENIQFTILTRKKDWETFWGGAKTFPSIQVLFSEEADLIHAYENSDICINYSPPIQYLQISAQVKMFEYIASGRPIFVFKGNGLDQLVAINNIGWVVDYKIEAIIDWLNFIVSNPKDIKDKVEALKKIKQQYSWIAVAQSLLKSLRGLK